MTNQITILEGRQLRLSEAHRIAERTAGTVLLQHHGQTVAVVPRRARPLSNPEDYIIFMTEDGSELGMLRSIQELDSESRFFLREALDHAYGLTTITRIIEVEKETLTGRIRWRVLVNPDSGAGDDLQITSPIETENGSGTGEEKSRLFRRRSRPARPEEEDAYEEREFFISGQEDVQTARYPHIYVVDIDRNRYEILDCEALDIESRRQAERYF